jgi:hypothetical protein
MSTIDVVDQTNIAFKAMWITFDAVEMEVLHDESATIEVEKLVLAAERMKLEKKAVYNAAIPPSSFETHLIVQSRLVSIAQRCVELAKHAIAIAVYVSMEKAMYAVSDTADVDTVSDTADVDTVSDTVSDTADADAV